MWLRSKNNYCDEELKIISHALTLYFHQLRHDTEEEKKVYETLCKIDSEIYSNTISDI